MLIAMITHPPAFGLKLKFMDDSAVRKMQGIRDVFTIKNYKDDYERQNFDTCTFNDLVVVVGTSTWEVMNAKKALKVEWEPFIRLHGNKKFRRQGTNRSGSCRS